MWGKWGTWEKWGASEESGGPAIPGGTSNAVPVCNHDQVEREPRGAKGGEATADATGAADSADVADSADITATHSPELPYSPGLDGMRALAVLAVMAFHSNFSWLPGGFYGVDTFFVLSGFLITSLLLVEHIGSGSIRLTRFWARRARRLLPALFVLVGCLAVIHLAWPNVLPWTDAVPDAAATLGYVANWHFIAAGSGYFASANQSPLLHTWSLAIEEQFYLVWPLVVLLVMGKLTRRGRSNAHANDPDLRLRRLMYLGALAVGGATASALWMWHESPIGFSPQAYYGTETRAQALLVGAALAVGLTLYRSSSKAAEAESKRVHKAGMLAGLAGVFAVAAVWHLIPETSTLAFHGGFMLASLGSALVIGGVVLSPRGPAAGFLSLRPIRYLGKISYGAYLWYWPVDLILSPQRLQMGEWPLFALRTGLTFGIAAASSKFIEVPIRRGNLSGFLSGWRGLIGAPVAAGAALSLVAVSAAVGAPAFTPVAAGAVMARTAAAAGGTATGARDPDSDGQPVRVMFVGDSMAGSLGASLSPEAARYDVEIVNEGHPGCGVSSDTEYRFLLYLDPPGPPCKVGDPDALLDQWRVWVDEYEPQVVVYLARIDLMNQDRNGSWTWIGNSSFDQYLSSQLRKGVTILGSRGAKVVLLTQPYYDSTIQSGGSVPEDEPDRVSFDDRILSRIAAVFPGVSVFPLGKVVTPSGTYQQDVDGVDVRCADGVHFSAQAGEVLAPSLFPTLVRLGRSAKVPAQAGSPQLPAAIPAWYDKLQCGQ